MRGAVVSAAVAFLICLLGASGGPGEAAALTMEQDADELAAEQLHDLVGRIALYPDDLLAQVLPAATFQLDVIAAARFLEAHPEAKEPPPEVSWDASVVALMHYPDVLQMMSDDLEWTKALAHALWAQEEEVYAAVQAFRSGAVDAGNLESDATMQILADDGGIHIVPAHEKLTYIPTYAPESIQASRANYGSAVYWGPGYLVSYWPYAIYWDHSNHHSVHYRPYGHYGHGGHGYRNHYRHHSGHGTYRHREHKRWKPSHRADGSRRHLASGFPHTKHRAGRALQRPGRSWSGHRATRRGTGIRDGRPGARRQRVFGTNRPRRTTISSSTRGRRNTGMSVTRQSPNRVRSFNGRRDSHRMGASRTRQGPQRVRTSNGRRGSQRMGTSRGGGSHAKSFGGGGRRSGGRRR